MLLLLGCLLALLSMKQSLQASATGMVWGWDIDRVKKELEEVNDGGDRLLKLWTRVWQRNEMCGENRRAKMS